MKNILIAGATGYLGSHIVKELQDKQINFKVIARDGGKLTKMGLSNNQIITAEVTNPKTLTGQLKGMDVLISTVGITRQKDGLTYMDVDYQANMNLLEEAKRSGIKKFIYISAIHGDQMRHLKIMAAKEKFVDALKASGLDYAIIRPNGFFSDMKDFLEMAKKGKVYLFGNGEFKLNPIHGADLAKVVVAAVESSVKEVIVGGPDILTQNEIGEMALRVQGKSISISHLPDWVRILSVKLLKILTSSKTYGPYEFFLTMMGQDNVAPRYGTYRLETFFREESDRIRSQTIANSR